MSMTKTIQVYEYGSLKVGTFYGAQENIEFKDVYFQALARFVTENINCPFYTLLHKRIRFCNFVGAIKVGDLTIEVLPKCDRHEDDKEKWQSVLLEMLAISLNVEAKTTTHSDINIRQYTVLETYLNLFLSETENLLHQGLVKKYRSRESNQNALKGKLLVHKQITKNYIHAERFYVSHQVYDCNNIYNSIIFQTLQCILTINCSSGIAKKVQALMLNFPECNTISINEKVFERLHYDRKTERYKTTVNLAKIILLNYHPDVRGGHNNILAIMFDMNLLWENYVYYTLKKSGKEISVKPQVRRKFWHQAKAKTIHLIPDIVLQYNQETVILDTKWKYRKDTSAEDVRQMYAYGMYFDADQNFLVYPDKIDDGKVRVEKGNFYVPGTKKQEDNLSCGFMFVDLLVDGRLNKSIGVEIARKLTIDQGE